MSRCATQVRSDDPSTCHDLSPRCAARSRDDGRHSADRRDHWMTGEHESRVAPNLDGHHGHRGDHQSVELSDRTNATMCGDHRESPGNPHGRIQLRNYANPRKACQKTGDLRKASPLMDERHSTACLNVTTGQAFRRQTETMNRRGRHWRDVRRTVGARNLRVNYLLLASPFPSMCPTVEALSPQTTKATRRWPLLKNCPAASYSPTQSPVQYHRR